MQAIGKGDQSRTLDRGRRFVNNCIVQQLRMRTRRAGSAAECAAEILETVPMVMRFIRAQMRRHRGPELSVPHFRTLLFLGRNGGASLSTLAEHLGLSLPATSRLVENLVRRDFVARRIPLGNRRQVALSLSARGRRTVAAARQATEHCLAEVVGTLPADERAAIQRALRTLREKFQLTPRPSSGWHVRTRQEQGQRYERPVKERS
jgi:DNA-binding MarR family transcriptional regulator